MCLQRVWEESTQTLSPVLTGSKRVSTNIFFFTGYPVTGAEVTQPQGHKSHICRKTFYCSDFFLKSAPDSGATSSAEGVLCLWNDVWSSLMFTDNGSWNSAAVCSPSGKAWKLRLFCTKHAGHFALEIRFDLFFSLCHLI